MAKKSESYGWIPFWSRINFPNWAAQLCGISREALQLSTSDSAVMRYPPSFPQALAEERLETWIYLSPRHFPLERKGKSVRQFQVNPQMQLAWALHQVLVMPLGARHRALHNPKLLSSSPSQLSGAKVNSGLSSKGLQLQQRQFPNSPPPCSEGWRQLYPGRLSWLYLACVLPSLPAPLMAKSRSSTHPCCTTLPTQLLLPRSHRTPFCFKSKGLEETGVAESNKCYSGDDLGLQSVYGEWWKLGILELLGKIWPALPVSAGATNPAPAPLFSDGKAPKEKSSNSFLLTHATRQKNKEPLVLRCKCCECGWGRFKEDLSSLGRGNTSKTGEFQKRRLLPSWQLTEHSLGMSCPLSRASVLRYLLFEIAMSARDKILPWTPCPKLKFLYIRVYWRLWEWQYPFININ